MQSELLQMMGNRFSTEVCAGECLWDKFQGFPEDFTLQRVMNLHRNATLHRPLPPQNPNIQLNESFLRWWRINAQGGCLAETACPVVANSRQRTTSVMMGMMMVMMS
jgi:hypothetical protein